MALYCITVTSEIMQNHNFLCARLPQDLESAKWDLRYLLCTSCYDGLLQYPLLCLHTLYCTLLKLAFQYSFIYTSC